VTFKSISGTENLSGNSISVNTSSPMKIIT